jgi:hypothetical protein
MFSDRWRLAKLLGVLVGLTALAWIYTDYAVHKPVGYRAARSAPADHDGAAMRFPLWKVGKVEGPARFTISRTLRDVPIQGNTKGLEPGETVSVVGYFHAADQVVIATEVHRHTLRPAKEALSLLGMLWALFMLPRLFMWREGRVVRRG